MNSICGNEKMKPFSRLLLEPSELPLRKSSTESTFAMT